MRYAGRSPKIMKAMLRGFARQLVYRRFDWARWYKNTDVLDEVVNWVLDGPIVARLYPNHQEKYMQKTWCLELRSDNLDPKFNELVTEHFLDAADRLDAIVNLGSDNEERMRLNMKVWTEDMIAGIQDIRDRRKRNEGDAVAKAIADKAAAPRGGSDDDLDFSALRADLSMGDEIPPR